MPLFFIRWPIPHCARLSHIIRAALSGGSRPVLLALIFTLTGCSTLRLGYNSAPELTYYWLDSYVDFDKSQAAKVREQLQALHRWHRKEELPQLAEMLRSAETLALQSPDGARLCLLYDSLLQRGQALAQQVLPGAAAIIPSLTADQLARLAQAYEKSNRKMRDEWRIANNKGMNGPTLKSLERLDDLYGSLTVEQRIFFKARMAETGFDEQMYLQEHLSRQRSVLQTFARLNGADTATAQAALAELWALYYASADLQYRQHHAQVQVKTCQAFAQLHAQTSAEQRKHMAKRLKDYESELRALALP